MVVISVVIVDAVVLVMVCRGLWRVKRRWLVNVMCAFVGRLVSGIWWLVVVVMCACVMSLVRGVYVMCAFVGGLVNGIWWAVVVVMCACVISLVSRVMCVVLIMMCKGS